MIEADDTKGDLWNVNPLEMDDGYVSQSVTTGNQKTFSRYILVILKQMHQKYEKNLKRCFRYYMCSNILNGSQSLATL